MVDLHPMPDSAEPDPLDGDDRPGRAAAGAALEGNVVAHQPPPMQFGRPWNDSCQLRVPMKLAPFDDDGDLLAVVETPKGSRNKYSWDDARGLFRLKSVLPAGAVFPFDFGFVPSTRGGDGDPLDVLLLMDERAFPGCLVRARLVGVIEAEESRKGKKKRNDRLIAVAEKSRAWDAVEELDDLDESLVSEIEHFFVSYNAFNGKKFEPIGRSGSERARAIVERGRRKSAGKGKGKKKK
jgi:inorganic pyrophosphatase